MGKAHSRIISLEDAEKRCSAEEWTRFNRGFDKLSRDGRLSKEAFFEAVLGSAVPKELAERIFDVFDAGQRGALAKKDFLCGMAVLARGEPDERVKFLFQVYDLDREGSIKKDNLRDLAKHLKDIVVSSSDREKVSIHNLIDEMFKEIDANEDDRVSFEEFKRWANQNMTPGLVTWIWELVPKEKKTNEASTSPSMVTAAEISIESPSEMSPSDKMSSIWTSRRATIASLTSFNEKEITELEKQYHKLKNKSPAVDRSAFKNLFGTHLGLPEMLMDKVFETFDRDKDGIVNTREFVVGLSHCCRGSEEQKLQFCFDAFDSDQDQKLSKSEFQSLIDSVWNLGVLNLTIKRTFCHDGKDEKDGRLETPQEAVSLLDVDAIFQKYDENQDGLLEYKDYANYMADNPGALEFINRIKHFVSLQMGVPPGNGLEERDIILELREQACMKVGDTYYVLCARWFRKWAEYANVDPVKFTMIDDEKLSQEDKHKLGLRPGKIDNSRLLKEKSFSELRQNLQETEDFIVVSETVWNAFSSWYGGGPTISRQAIPAGKGVAQTVLVELYPMTFYCKIRNPPGIVTCSISRSCTLHYMREKVCSIAKINPDDVMLWDVFKEDNPKMLEDITQTIEDAKLTEGQKLYFDVRLENGKFIGFKTESKDQDQEEDEEKEQEEKKDKTKVVGDSQGLVGLYNLGNTCFMNSAIQCLSLSSILTQYFLKDLYVWEINQENPLGMEGKVALAYGALLKRIYNDCSKFDAIGPRGMKWTIGKFAPQFVGFQQHDAQELIQFLLDGLHEGLNRVHEKPYIMIEDSNGRPNEEVAAEQWDAFLKRNQSIIVDIFMGQLKSTLRWSCGRENVKFDPYSVLSLPLPKPDRRFVDITVVFNESTRAPVRFSVNVRAGAPISEMRIDLAELAGIPTKSLYLVELFNSIVYNNLNLHNKVEGIRQNDVLFAFEIPSDSYLKPKVGVEDDKEEDVLPPPPLAEFEFNVGDKFDCLDKWQKWWNATVREVKENEVFFHYDNWPDKYDEWINKKSDRIQPLNSRATPKEGDISIRPKFEGMNIDPDWICVHLCHRLLIPQEDYFLLPYRPRLFGLPVVLFVNPNETTNEDLYEQVWHKVQRFAPSPPESEISVSPPFTLSRIKRGGSQCSKCSWIKSCLGCQIELTKDKVDLNHSESIAIDWNYSFYEKYLNQKEMMEIWDHESVRKYKDFLHKKIDFKVCMEQFTEKEVLDGDSAPYCSNCKEMHSASKTLEPWSTPPILIIHLKRLVQGAKISTFVEFPLTSFDPSPFLGRDMDGKEKQLYDLFAVVNHFGSSGAGHYVTYGFVREENAWFCFDDSRVSKMDEKDVCSKNAYMLFYLRRGVKFEDILISSLKEKLDVVLPEDLKSILSNDEIEPPAMGDLCPWMSRIQLPNRMAGMKMPLLGSKNDCRMS